jgi:competence protein ComEC
VAYYFHILTPISGPANIPAVPLCGLVLISNLSSLLLAGWFPFAAGLFNNSGWLCMRLIQMTTHWSALMPKAYFYVPIPSLFTIALYYLILLTVFTGWLWQGQWRRWKLGGIAVLSVVWSALWLTNQPVARLTILPLDGGHAVYVNSSKGHQDSLIDTGNELSVEMVVKPFLQAQGVNRLDHFILTHGEIGFTGGAQPVSELFIPRNIHASTVHFRSPEYLKFQTKMESAPAWRKPLQSGDVLGPWTILHPAATNHFSRAADNALVLRGEFGGSRVLLLSNLGRSGQNALLEQTNALRADLVVAGLPSDGEPLCDALLDAIQPRAIIIVDADFPAFRRAKKILQDRLAGRRVPVIYTRNANAVTLVMRSKSWELTTMDGMRISSQHPAMPAP